MMNDIGWRVPGLMDQARRDLAELAAIRSVADPRRYPTAECTRAAKWVVAKFAEAGFTDLAMPVTADGSRAVVGTLPSRLPDAPTVLLYAHYDVQPPLDEALWRTPPFELIGLPHAL